MFAIKPQEFTVLRAQAEAATKERHYQDLVEKMNGEFQKVASRLKAGEVVHYVGVEVSTHGKGDDYAKALAERLVQDLHREGHTQAYMQYQEEDYLDGPNMGSPSRTLVYVDLDKPAV